MIAPSELLELKQRLLIGADAAYRIAATTDQFVMHDQEQYELVMRALLSMKADVRRLLAEHDILRGMFAERLSAFFMEGLTNDGTGGAESVPSVQGGEGVGGGETPRPVEAGADSTVLPSGPTRKRSKRSNPRRNRKGDSELPSVVGRSDREVAVDGGKDD